MAQAFVSAIHGRGRAEPNPMVGCVIVKEGRVIGQAYHEQFGGPHAEPLALSRCGESPAGATAYATLEPCCHINKKTPPCVPRLIEAKLARVVIGCLDPNPAVAGNGVSQLRAAGIEVTVGVLESQAKQLIAPFYKRAVLGRPYVTLKWAESSNGKVAGAGGRPIHITGPRSDRVVHELRSRSDAILVGINTVLADNPLLTARRVPIHRPLLRAVLDTHLRIPLSSRLVQTAGESPVVVYCSAEAFERHATEKIAKLLDANVQVRPLHPRPRYFGGGRGPNPQDARAIEPPPQPSPGVPGEGENSPPASLSLDELLADIGGTHLLVEPGPTLAQSFIRQNLFDRIWIFRSSTPIDDPNAPSAIHVSESATGSVDLDADTLTEYLNPSGRAFFANSPSADLQIISFSS
jgi:riboflavin biosynthesis protein RibD